MWGSFGVSLDLQKLADTDMTMEAIDPKMEDIPKLLYY